MKYGRRALGAGSQLTPFLARPVATSAFAVSKRIVAFTEQPYKFQVFVPRAGVREGDIKACAEGRRRRGRRRIYALFEIWYFDG